MRTNDIKRKKTIDKLRTPFAIYANIAVSSVERFIGIKKTSDKIDPIDVLLQNNFNDEEKLELWSKIKQNLFIAEFLIQKQIFLKNEVGAHNDEVAISNFNAFIKIISILRDVRNFWSHTRHKIPEIENIAIKETILKLYQISCSNTNRNIPHRYRGERGIFHLELSNEGDVEIKLNDDKVLKGNYTNQFDYTGYIFFITLFLMKHEVNDFLNNLEQSYFDFDEIKKRQAFKERFPGIEFPKHLRSLKKDFLFGREVYTEFAIRGHKDTLNTTEESYFKEQAFSVLEYLKRCPAERLINKVSIHKQDELGEFINTGFEQLEKESSDIYLDSHQLVKINHEIYPLREKNKFIEYVLSYLENEWEYLGLNNHKVFNWKWARRASASIIKGKKEELQKKNPLSKVAVHQKIVWDIPQSDEYLINDRGEENGFPHFIENDKNGKPSHVIFKLKKIQNPTKDDGCVEVIGRLNCDTLCTILENYFFRFPVQKKDSITSEEQNQRRRYFENIFTQIQSLIISKTQKGKGGKRKDAINDIRIKNRIDYLRSKWKTEKEEIISSKKEHYKIVFIARSWNKMITFNQTNNLAHAKDYKNITGGKNGYQEIIKYLSLMTDILKRDEARNNLLRTLNSLGNRDGISYSEAINNQLYYAGISGSPKSGLRKQSTIDQYFDQACRYNMAMLNKFEKKLNSTFNVDDWRPNAEMRWLGMKDNRTPDASQSKQNPPSIKNTGIYNVDNHYFTYVGINAKELKYVPVGIGSKKEGEEDYLGIKHKYILKPNGNNLVIEDFYSFPEWELLPKTDRLRLYDIKRQDVVLANIAYYFTMQYEASYSNRTLNSLDFQKDEMILPVSLDKHEEEGGHKAYIKMYYRHFKQNRYRLTPSQTKNILSILINHELIKDRTVHLNHLVKKPIDSLTFEEKKIYLSSEELEKPEEKQLNLANAFIKNIKEKEVLVPIASNKRDRFYLSEILTGYQLCRKAFLIKIFTLERIAIKKFKLKPNGEGFVSFDDIAESLLANNLLSEVDKENLLRLRNFALHNGIPTGSYLPDKKDLIQLTKDEASQEFIDFFGKGMNVATNVIEELRKEEVSV